MVLPRRADTDPRTTDRRCSDPHTIPEEIRRDYRAQFRDPARVHAVCEQYRAAATHDVAHDEASRERGITAPVLVLWSDSGPVASWYDPLEVWRSWATDVIGGPVRSGHFLAEEAPTEAARLLREFFSSGPAGRTGPPGATAS